MLNLGLLIPGFSSGAMPTSSYSYSAAANASLTKNMVITLLIVVALWLIYLILRFVINRRFKDVKKRYSWRSRVFYTILVLSIYFIGRVWFDGLQDILALLSIVAAALTITQKESLMNLTGCVLILWRDLFQTGDRIQTQNYYGEVTAIRTFHFHLLEIDPHSMGQQTTGRIIKIPNSTVITAPVINCTELFPFIWREFKVTVSADSDLVAAQQKLTEIIDLSIKPYYNEAKRYLKQYVKNNYLTLQQLDTQSFIQLSQEKPAGICIVVRYLALPNEQNRLESKFLHEFLTYLKQDTKIKLIFGS